jgi:oligopeptidase B
LFIHIFTLVVALAAMQSLLLLSTISFLVCSSLGRVVAFRSSPSFVSRPHRRLVVLAMASNHNDAVLPPVARREEDRVVLAGVGPPPRQSESSTNKLMDPPVPVPDPYGWMRDEKRENEEVLEHLKAENKYTEALTASLEPLRKTLYDEMLAKLQETDHTVPKARGDWWYYTRTIEGKSYTIHCRAPKTTDTVVVDWDGTAESPILPGEEVTLDVNQLAEGHDYCATGSVTTSPSHKLLAYSVDFKGDETCQLFVKDLATGEIVDHDESLVIYGSLRWGADDSTLFYLKMDDTKRPFQVWKRTLGSDGEDELLFEDLNELYWVHMYKSLDNKYLFIDSSSKETSEIHYLDLQDPNAKLQCVAKRRTKVLYEVEHRKGTWWISSNVGGTPNMRLMTSPAQADCEAEWKDVVDKDGKPLFDGGYERSLSDVATYATHVVAQGREGGIPRVWILSLDGDAVESCEQLTFEEAAHDTGLSKGFEFDTDSVVLFYDSLITPLQNIQIKLADTSDRTVIKKRNVPGYNKTEYDCDRITVTARDGTEIPCSLVYRKEKMMESLKRRANQFTYTCTDTVRMVLVLRLTFVPLVSHCWIEALCTLLLT